MLSKIQRVTKRTRRPSANRELARREERFQRLVEALPDAVYVVSADRLVFANLFGMRLLGAQSPEQLVGRHISEIINPGYLAKVKRQNRRSYGAGATSSVEEIVIRSLDGSQVSVEALAIPITWDGVPAVEVVVRDIRERKGTQQRLREYEKAVEGLEEMIVVVDREYRYVLANRAFLKYREMEREQVVGRLVSELLHKDIFENQAGARW